MAIASVPSEELLGETTYRLFLRWKGGEEEALEALCDRYSGPLRRFLHLRLPRGSRSLLETGDLVQSTLLSTFQRLEDFEYEKPRALAGYLFTVARNLVQDELRSLSRRPPPRGMAAEPADPGPSPLEELIGRERIRLYEEALAKLRPEDRDLIFHRLELGFPFERIAQVLGKPSADAARVATGRAVHRLARLLRDLAAEAAVEL